MKKRYLITYKEQNVSKEKMTSILGESKKIVEFNLKTKLLADGGYHFSKLGITSTLLSESEAQKLRQNAQIDFVEEDSVMHILGELSNAKPKLVLAGEDSWNMKLIKAPEAWKKGYAGKGVKLAIIDTGIAKHPDLSIKGGVSFVAGSDGYNDDNGHGTHCAGIAAGLGVKPENVRGVASDVSLYAVKVMNAAGKGNTSDIIAGMAWSVENEINVVSMSLGGENDPSEAYAVAVKACQSNGTVVVCASGNSYNKGTGFPYVNAPANSWREGDAVTKPIAVGSVDNQSVIAASSSRGGRAGVPIWNQVGVVAPGVAIYSTYLNNGYATLSGTSMACPHVAGLCALMIQKRGGITPLQIKADIEATATSLGIGTPNETYGYGLINCDKAINL